LACNDRWAAAAGEPGTPAAFRPCVELVDGLAQFGADLRPLLGQSLDDQDRHADADDDEQKRAEAGGDAAAHSPSYQGLHGGGERHGDEQRRQQRNHHGPEQHEDDKSGGHDEHDAKDRPGRPACRPEPTHGF
jgi:hypothetical protein